MPLDGVIRVEDLLRSPALQLRLVAGESGTSRRVAWAHVSELEDPTPWLFGSEMIMTTGIAIPAAPHGSVPTSSASTMPGWRAWPCPSSCSCPR
jgi:Purine catabolism regulatory protein-like family